MQKSQNIFSGKKWLTTLLLVLIVFCFWYIGYALFGLTLVLICFITRPEIALWLMEKIKTNIWLKWCIEFKWFGVISILLSTYAFYLGGVLPTIEILKDQYIIWFIAFLATITGLIAFILSKDKLVFRRVSKVALFLALIFIFLQTVTVMCVSGGGC
jgi:hypothetical protein